MLGDLNAALPAWVSEGAAELFGTAQPKKDGSMVFGYVPQYRVYSLNTLRTMSTAEMVGATDKKIDSDERAEIYARGWLLTHMLTFGKERSGQLNRYIAGIQKGMGAEESAKSAFGDLNKLGRDLDRYMDKPRLNGLVLPASEFRAIPIAIRPLGEAEGAAVPVRTQLDRGVSKDNAEKLAGEARRVAARYPTDPVVLTALAAAEQAADHDAQAIAAADRALAANPNSSAALLTKSRALLSLAEKEPAKADWQAIRALISRANRLDPDDAEPLMLFYRSFLDQGIAPTANSVKGLLYAQALVPQDDALRVMAVRQLLAEDKFQDPRRMLAPIAYDPHAGKQGEALLKIMDALAASDGTAARSILDEQDKLAEKEREKEKDRKVARAL
jgi:tetratricopeptide (TPR) repeat protein